MPTAVEIEVAIAARIIRGEWKSGQVVPTTREFAAEYGVGLSTMYHILDRLKRRNLIRGEQGGRRYVV